MPLEKLHVEVSLTLSDSSVIFMRPTYFAQSPCYNCKHSLTCLTCMWPILTLHGMAPTFLSHDLRRPFPWC